MAAKFRPFLCSLIALSFCLNAENGWEKTELIWNFGLTSSCDVGCPENPKVYFRNEAYFNPHLYNNIRSGDIVWVQSQFVSDFCNIVLPTIQTPFVLIVSENDNSFPSECLSQQQVDELLNNDHLIHLFAQNCDYKGPSPKVSHIPIGIDFHTVAYKNDLGGWGIRGSAKQQESLLLEIAQKAPPTSKRLARAFVDFQHSDTMHASFQRYLQFSEDRASIFQTIVSSGVIDYGPWMNRQELWQTKSNYAFSISPHGNGYDCHRTWEDLALGCIVIVKTSPLDPLYTGLPVVIIQDWSEINEANFQKWLTEYSSASTNPDFRHKISHSYWWNKIEKAANPYR